MDLLEDLNQFKAYKLEKYEQPFDDGKVIDLVYCCTLFDGLVWRKTEYGHTPEKAFERAKECIESI